MSTIQEQEKRSARRREIEFPLEFRGGHGMTRNISSSGFLFSTLEQFRPRQRFSFTLMPFHSPPVHGFAEVVRAVELDDHFDVAASFSVIALDDSLAAEG
ncbi:MAG: hypothetical protein RJA36_1361 [Pseudomonadota bacterium]|jgi:hypothetical protein